MRCRLLSARSAAGTATDLLKPKIITIMNRFKTVTKTFSLRAAFGLLISLTVIGSVAAQQSALVPSPRMTAAGELYRNKKYAEAVTAYQAIVGDEPNNGRAWYFLGMSLHLLGRYRDAIGAFEKNVAIARNPGAMYNIASGHSRLNEPDKAFEWLEMALAAGAAASVNIEADPDLANIRSDARFKRMIDLADRGKRPCMYLAEARQFDFWIGDWDVFNPAGQKAGTNSVQLFSEGCGLMENWTGTQGGDGKSINFFDPGTKKWYQSWIGSGGGALRYSGSYRDGAMRYEGETIGPDGKTTLQKLTITKIDENTVRQLAETSVDGGKNWSVSYDLKYVRRQK